MSAKKEPMCKDFSPALGDYLLDSSLKSPPKYNLKVVQCGDYYQFYFFDNKKNVPKDKEHDFFDLNLKKINSSKDEKEREFQEIELKNINRSKLACQRLAKANIECWKTFITLTFAENISELEYCNKKFEIFVKSIRRNFPDFKYICVPEFQKRGAVHYHLLTNIDVSNDKLIYRQIGNNKFFHVRYWNYGFDKVQLIKGDVKKIVGYISKYMTKDIDNRLFGKKRYFYSQNLRKPSFGYLDLTKPNHQQLLNDILSQKNCIYNNIYSNPYNNENVAFLEYL